MSHIGFIGLGHMGTPMVKNLLKHEHQVKVFDLAPQVATSLAEYGAIPVPSFAELANDAEIIFTMLPSDQDVENIWLIERKE